MPYIVPQARRYLAKAGRIPRTTGELNYCLTRTFLKYMGAHPRISYELMAYVVGTLEELSESIGGREWHLDRSPGLERLLGKLIDSYLRRKGRTYVTHHERKQLRGTLRCAQLELYRRQIGPYEDLKMKSNGDVYSA